MIVADLGTYAVRITLGDLAGRLHACILGVLVGPTEITFRRKVIVLHRVQSVMNLLVLTRALVMARHADTRRLVGIVDVAVFITVAAAAAASSRRHETMSRDHVMRRLALTATGLSFFLRWTVG